MRLPLNHRPLVGLVSPPALAARFALNFPTNLTVISGALKKAGFGAKIVDLNLEAAREEKRFFDDAVKCSMDIIDQRMADADVFGITTLCSTYPFVLQLAAALKDKYDKPIVLGGPQATMTAKRTMELFPSIDFIVAHEGEITFVELLRSIFENGDPRQVQGIYGRHDGCVYATPQRPFIANLDESPFPDFGAIDIRAYQDIYPDVRVPLDTGRGCPFKCTFCSTAMMWKRTYRMKSSQRTVAEMDALHRQFGVRWFFLTQDNLTTSKEYIHELCQMLKRKQYVWDCYSRCDTLTDEVLREMADAGCSHIFFGIETGSERFQKVIRKNLKFERVQEAVAACVRQEVGFSTAYIIGFPDEDRDDLAATLRSCFRDAARAPRQIIFSVLAPLPGTEVLEKFQDRLTAPLAFQPDFSPMLLKNASAEEARRMIEAHPDLFSSFYFLKPMYIELDELFEIRNFYYMLIDEFPRMTHLVFRWTPVGPFDLLDRYRKTGAAVKPEAMTAETMSRCYTEIIEQHCQEPIATLMREILKYEAAIHQVRSTPTPSFLRESQDRAVRLSSESVGLGCLSKSPALVARSFQVDINRVLKALTVEDYRYQKLEVPLEMLFYEDALRGEVVVEEVDRQMVSLLAHVGRNGAVDPVRHRAQLLELVRKGVLVHS